jgi:hypothetical protein
MLSVDRPAKIHRHGDEKSTIMLATYAVSTAKLVLIIPPHDHFIPATVCIQPYDRPEQSLLPLDTLLGSAIPAGW